MIKSLEEDNKTLDTYHLSLITISMDSFKIAIDELSRLMELFEGAEKDNFEKAINIILNRTGRVIVCGLGKSGLVGQKISATFSSTGVPSIFIHATEAYHGDLGSVLEGDVVILISYSGETDEVIRLIPVLKQRNIKIISIVGNMESSLAKNSDAALYAGVTREACPNNLAPTTSCITTLAVGDAIAVSIMEKTGFEAEDFAKNHPGGSLGKRLLTKVSDVMRIEDLPIVSPSDSIADVIMTITKARMGIAIVIHKDNLEGVITDGDLRRMMLKTDNLKGLQASDIMSHSPHTVNKNMNLFDAEETMLENKVTSLVVTDGTKKVCGLLEIYDKGET